MRLILNKSYFDNCGCDDANQRTAINYATVGTTFGDFTYVYDNAGRRI
jgi:hypothetical protein